MEGKYSCAIRLVHLLLVPEQHPIKMSADGPGGLLMIGLMLWVAVRVWINFASVVQIGPASSLADQERRRKSVRNVRQTRFAIPN
jgi:hypothetical protein